MAKNAHLTLDDRIAIQTALRERKTFKQIGDELGKHPSTIAKEVKRNSRLVEKENSNYCLNRGYCRHKGDVCETCISKVKGLECRRCKQQHCYKQDCPDFVRDDCIYLTRPPYVCNGCSMRLKCKLPKYVYNGKLAQKEYETNLRESRQGIAISRTELQRIDSIISPLIRQGQSVHHICVTNADEIMLDEKTIYKYIDDGLLSVRNIDLPRKVRYRVRKKKKPFRVDKKCYEGRTYEDFLKFMEEHPDLPVVEMDSVEGCKGGKVLLTILFRNCKLMLAYLRDMNTARSVTEVFERLYEQLGHEKFTELFPVILTDRGGEFTDPLSIEFNKDNKRRTYVFYCDPQRSDQKGSIEVCHEFIRRALPKGKSFDKLSQDDILKLMSHINSYKRKKLNNRSAQDLFSLLYGEDTLKKLGIFPVPSLEIVVTPDLFTD